MVAVEPCRRVILGLGAEVVHISDVPSAMPLLNSVDSEACESIDTIGPCSARSARTESRPVEAVSPDFPFCTANADTRISPRPLVFANEVPCRVEDAVNAAS